MPTHGDFPWEREHRAAGHRVETHSLPYARRGEPSWSVGAVAQIGSYPTSSHAPGTGDIPAGWRVRRRSAWASVNVRRARTGAALAVLTAIVLIAHRDGTPTAPSAAVTQGNLPGAYVVGAPTP